MELNLDMEQPSVGDSRGKTLRLLFLCYWFPPHAEVGGLRVAKFSRYLPEHGVEPYVLCSDAPNNADDSYQVPRTLQVQRVAGRIHPLDLYRNYKSRFLRSQSDQGQASLWRNNSGHPGFLLRHFFAMLQYPDRYWTWRKVAYESGKKIIVDHNIQCVFSSGPPWVSHVVARELKRNLRVQWFADYRDPWTEDLTDWLPHWYRQAETRLERNCVHEADIVLCNTERMRQAFINKFTNEVPSKFRPLPNGFEDGPCLEHVSATKRTILHLGTIYANRKIDGFCQALRQLLRSGELNPSQHSVEFYGSNDLKYETSARRIYPELFSAGLLTIHPRISFAEAQERMWRSDVLLIFQGDHPLCVPSKYYECARTGIPILAITREGALTDIMKECSVGLSADPDNPGEIAVKLMSALSSERRQLDLENGPLARYHSRVLASNLATLLRTQITIGTTD